MAGHRGKIAENYGQAKNMRRIIFSIRMIIRNMFLNKETTREIHDTKSKFTGVAHKSITKTNKARKDLEEIVLSDYFKVVSGGK